MQGAIRRAEVLDSDELFAVQRRHEQDARVDGAVADAAVLELAEDDRAGAAVALRAALLGTPSRGNRPQVGEHRHGRINLMQGLHPAVQNEADGAGHGSLSPLSLVLSSLFSLRRVILRCSSAATTNSTSALFGSRCSRNISISAAVRPVAQTMKR